MTFTYYSGGPRAHRQPPLPQPRTRHTASQLRWSNCSETPLPGYIPVAAPDDDPVGEVEVAVALLLNVEPLHIFDIEEGEILDDVIVVA